MTKNMLSVTTPSDREILMTREFEAPRALVWDAMTRPDLLRRWLFGPPGWSMTTCDSDLRVGGEFRWAWRGPEGQDLVMHGVYREVQPPRPGGEGGRIVRTETFDVGCEAQTGEQVATLALAELAPGRTRLTLTVEFPSKEARDAAIASGMDRGVSAGYDRLDGLLADTHAA